MKIVCGTDGSPDAEAALTWAAQQIERTGGQVILVYSIEMIYPSAPMAMPVLPEVDEARRAEAAIALEERAAVLRDRGIEYTTVTENGNAAAALERVADDEDADMIVVGRRGRGAFTSMLLGSVTNQLLHHTKHVLVVMPPTD